MTQELAQEEFSKISEEEFWNAMIFAPIKRMGYSNGPGTVFHGECRQYRECSVTGQTTDTRKAHFVLATPDEKGAFYEYNGDVTLEEFKALCSRIIPGVGACHFGWGEDL